MYYFFYKNVKKITVENLKLLCEENFLDYKLLREIREEHLRLWRIIMPHMEYKDTSVKTYDNYTNLIFSFLTGYNIFIARVKENNKKNYKNLFPKTKTFASIDKNSLLKTPGEYIFYLNLKCMSGNRSFGICNKLTKNQIEIFSSKLGYNIHLKNEYSPVMKQKFTKKKTSIRKPRFSKKNKK
jgi:hypothetical protein